MSNDQNFRPVRTTDRTLDLLELLAERAEGISFNDIASRLSLPKSSLSGLLRTLTARRYVARTNDGRRFRLGSKVLDLSVSYLHDGNQLEAVEQAMRRLAREVGEAAHVAVLDAADVIYVAVESSLHSMRISSALGRRLPAHATAVGKSLLATLSDDEIDHRLSAKLSQRTPRTITSLSVLKREIAQIRRLGYAYDAEEFAAGLHCVAAPVLDENGRAIASIGVSIPRARLEDVGITRIPSAVLAVAKEMSRTAFPAAGMLWQPRRVKVAWSMASIHVQAYQIIYHTVEKISAQMKTDVIWCDAKDDAVKQTVDVASLLALKPDVILIHPVHAVESEQLFAQAEESHVRAITFQRPVRSSNIEFFVGGDTYQQGIMTTAYVARALHGKGGIVMIQGDPYDDNARNLAQGTYDKLREYPGISLLADQPSPSWSREKAQRIAEAMLREHDKKIKAFIVANDDMAEGVAEVLETHGLSGEVILVGGDGDLQALERIKAGKQHGTAFQNWMELASETLRFAVDVAQGQVERGKLQRRRILHNPPGAAVYVKELPYTFVDNTNVGLLEDFWETALNKVLPELALEVVPATDSISLT